MEAMKKILRDAQNEATELRCRLNGHREFIAAADKVLTLIQLAAIEAHTRSNVHKCRCKGGAN
ncbi:MAG: hypothetical protein WCJ37_02570 [Syntrophus sp. (in: bacteria)]